MVGHLAASCDPLRDSTKNDTPVACLSNDFSKLKSGSTGAPLPAVLSLTSE